MEIELLQGGPVESDLLVGVRLRYFGFSAETDTWIVWGAWLAFSTELVALEAKRQGRARLTSIPPDELDLVVRSTDRAGHMCVEGLVGVEHMNVKASLRFAELQFDPSCLVDLVRAAKQITSGAAQRP